MTHRLSRPARRDVLLIWRHIAQDNEPAADRFVDRLMRAFLLGDNPHAGRRRDELRSGYRSFGGENNVSRRRVALSCP